MTSLFSNNSVFLHLCSSPNVNRELESFILSSCFIDTTFLLIPSIFFICYALMSFYFLKGNTFKIKISFLILLKYIFVILLSIITVIYSLAPLVVKIQQNYQIFLFEIISPLLDILSLFIALLLLHFHRIKGIYSSGIFHIYWLFHILYNAILLLKYCINFNIDTTFFPIYFFIAFQSSKLFITLTLLILTLKPEKIPISWFDAIAKPIPEESATFLSQITWWWLNGLIWKGYRKAIERTDLWSLNRIDDSTRCVDSFEHYWEMENYRINNKLFKRLDKDKFRKSLKMNTFQKDESMPLLLTQHDNNSNDRSKINSFIVILRTYISRFLMCAMFKLFNDILTFVSPQILKLMINFINSNEPFWHGIIYSLLLTASSIIQSLLLHQYFHRAFRLGMNIRSSLIGVIYKKSLRLSNHSRQKSTIGEIVNLMSVDSQRLMDLMTYIHMIWSAPLQILLSVVFLYLSIQISVFPGLVIMILLIPINGFISYLNRKIQVRQMKLKDTRIKLLNELLNGIKIIKLYSWEGKFMNNVTQIRDQELRLLRYSALLGACAAFTWSTAPFLVSLASFSTFVLTGNELTPEKAFVALALFNILRFPLSMLPFLITFLVECSVSISRLNVFLNHHELDPNAVIWHRSPNHFGLPSISFKNCSFAWNFDNVNALENISINISSKSLVGIVGQVGSGKSSLLSSILGEMVKINGTVTINGTLAYVPQIAWIQNATLKENILFNSEFNSVKYDDILAACALIPDLKIFPGGDQIEIGEKGINLSGGQKQRVSLARAIYQDSDIYLFDDPLSAVDPHVGQHIFKEVVSSSGLLREKTRLFITHNLAFVHNCDYIIMLNNGRILEEGTFNELLSFQGEFYRIYNSQILSQGNILSKESFLDGDDLSKLNHNASKNAIDNVENSDKNQENDSKKNLIVEENVEKSVVKLSVVISYIKSISIFLSLLILILYLFSNLANGASSLWLSHWSDQSQNYNQSNGSISVNFFYLKIYAVLGIFQGIFSLFASFSLAYGAVSASNHLHKILLFNVVRSPISFFNTTPMGRILNRFSKDIYIIDETIPRSIRSFLNTFFFILITIFIISYSTPIFISVIIPLAISYILIQRFYVSSSRQLKRIESASRSPIYSHFQETILGKSVIRAFNRQSQFIQTSDRIVDDNQEAYYPNICSNRWLAIRLEFIGHSIVLFASSFAVLSRQLGITSAGLVGLSISYALNITQSLNWLVRMTSELETNFVSIERVKEYAELMPERFDSIAPPTIAHNWPQNGEIEFCNYSLSYSPQLDTVLKNISFKISSCQRCAIVGRTGAGKSTLTLALFRVIEALEGYISIDGVNINNISLEVLRPKLTIIPQDPLLFSGTLKFNLDPNDSFDESKIWNALDLAHIKETILQTMPKGLDQEIQEGGENLSVGQRQLVCLARALLRNSRIIILDEATASIDMETDDIIQKSIRENFTNSTVITIAHRIKTIIDYDRIVVLELGSVVENDTPTNLLQQKNGYFYKMARDAGLV